MLSLIMLLVIGLAVGAGAAHLAEAILAQRSLVMPRCPYCQTEYSVWQWSATLALLSGHWRCAACGKPSRGARLAGELLLALSWAGLVGWHGLTLRVALAMLASLPLVMVLVTDLETKLIPNRIILPSLGVMLALGMLFGPAVPGIGDWRWWDVLLGSGIGFAFFWILVIIGVALLGEGALGGGDVKLAAYLGAVVGWPLIIVALLLAFVLGGVGAFAVLLSRRGSLRTAIPYGPYLVLGGLIVLLYGVEIVRWYLLT
ncbi:MAG: A24 family peptidase [Chloroflexota bacterium]|nr:A24 family peptidase [Chloroflexota bacterium]